MSRYDDARSLLRAVYSSEIDLLPNAKDKTLTVRLHPLANQSSDDAVRHLCAELNRTEPLFPGTELRLVYELVSSHKRVDLLRLPLVVGGARKALLDGLDQLTGQKFEGDLWRFVDWATESDEGKALRLDLGGP